MNIIILLITCVVIVNIIGIKNCQSGRTQGISGLTHSHKTTTR